MTMRKTNFPQVPVEYVKKIARQVDVGEKNVIFESPAAKTEPYATAIKATVPKKQPQPEE